MSNQELNDALGSLATAGKRVKIHNAQVVLKVPAPVKKLVEDHAKASKVSAATVVRWAVAEYFERRGIGR